MNYAIVTNNCSNLDKKWFFILFHVSPMRANFVNFGVCWKGSKWLLSIWLGNINWTEFKNVKQVGKILILYLIFYWLNCKLVRSLNKEWSLHAKHVNKTLHSNDKSISKYYYSIVYGHYFIVIINRAFYAAIFNVS